MEGRTRGGERGREGKGEEWKERKGEVGGISSWLLGEYGHRRIADEYCGGAAVINFRRNIFVYNYA